MIPAVADYYYMQWDYSTFGGNVAGPYDLNNPYFKDLYECCKSNPNEINNAALTTNASNPSAPVVNTTLTTCFSNGLTNMTHLNKINNCLATFLRRRGESYSTEEVVCGCTLHQLFLTLFLSLILLYW